MSKASAVLLVLTACVESPSSGAADAGHAVSATLRACAERSATVSTISAFVNQVNVLPMPVTVPCAVASLKRPLDVVATNSITSAQPAVGSRNPRIFVLAPGLAISVVPEGMGAPLIELGEWLTATRTEKGELLFPVTEPLTPRLPRSRVLFTGSSTTCGLCHNAEQYDAEGDGRFVSDAFRPRDETLVPLSLLIAEHEACSSSPDAGERCQLYHALFDFGLVRASAFDARVNIFGH